MSRSKESQRQTGESNTNYGIFLAFALISVVVAAQRSFGG
jgi:hypothetical protein